jgi:N-acetylglucosamine kinase-like BadF-type ATPase
MSSKLILGVDGGATKSHVVMFDSTGKCAGTVTYGPLNHEVMEGSYAELEERLGELIPRALNQAGATVDDVAYSVFGLAGVDTDVQQARISDIVGRVGLKDYLVCNDAFLGVAAGCPDCVGICAINGTGFKLAAIDNSGAVIHTCGVGGYTDDRGGGTWYGTKAIGEVYNELYKLGKPTAMKDMLFNALGITRKEDLLEVIIKRIDGEGLNHVEINSIAFKAAALGDDVAIKLLDESAEQYAGAITRLAMDLDFSGSKTLYVTLAGSVFVKQPVRILQDLLEKRIKETLGSRHVEYICLDAPPVAGAAMWAAQKAAFDIKRDSITAALAGL